MAVTRKLRSAAKATSQPSRAHCTRTELSRTRTHQELNYAEQSTDDDDFLDGYATSASESSANNESSGQAKLSKLKQTPLSRSQKANNKRAWKSHDVTRSYHGTRARSTRQSQPQMKLIKRSRSAVSQRSKRRKVAVQDLQGCDHVPGTNIPNWRDPRIPFECWIDIFMYAAREGSTDILSCSWLIHAATTCKALAEPALTALYRCPAIKTTAKAKRLASLLDRSGSDTLYNYRTKIDALHIDIRVIPLSILFQLIHPLPRLKEIIIYTTYDQPPYRELDRAIRWHYPEDVFRALRASSDDPSVVGSKAFPTILKNWEWSGRFIGGFVPDFDSIAAIHQTTSFSHLTRLCLTNFQVPSLKRLQFGSEAMELESYNEDGAVIASVARAISMLTALKHLVFESSTVMNDRMLPLLPKNLLHLELINCWEVKSEDLAAFLRTHGGDMRTLTLMHNQSLDLGFLTDLGETCPRLRHLDMNLSYYRHHDCVNDADPMYDQALLPSQVPMWPTSLRILNIEHIRDWTVETAEMFLQSIIDSAPHLPDLRHLAIKTMLDIPWQSRARMRREWRSKMERVFLRPYVPPSQSATLLRSTSGAGVPTQPPLGSGNLPDSQDATRQSPRKLARHHGDDRPSYKEPDTDFDELSSEEQGAEEEQQRSDDSDSAGDETTATTDSVDQAPSFIHGNCITVNISFDNQKVRELQYSMEDFGSEESDSGEEWDGDYDEDEHAVAF